MNRRDFLKIVGITTATSTAALYGCGSKEGSSEGSKVLGPIPTDKMTYRSFPGLGSDKVSILGYGCMRWPTVPAPDGKGEMIDQDAVNELVDYAIAHGVNYFDTSPMYVQGWSEKSTGIALKRHPRESFYLATKLSNFHPDTWTREGSIAMYRKSFEDMQVDYIDYYLLHMIGGGGMEQFRKRYIDNGMIDFLVKEREAGRIRRLGWSFHGDIEVYDYALQMHDRGEVHWVFVLGKQMVSTYSQQIESHCGDIPIQRDIGRRENTIVPVGTVESCRHQSDSKFGVTGIMRPAYNAEIKFLVFLFFVGIVEVIQNFSEKTAFLGKRVYRIRRN